MPLETQGRFRSSFSFGQARCSWYASSGNWSWSSILRRWSMERGSSSGLRQFSFPRSASFRLSSSSAAPNMFTASSLTREWYEAFHFDDERSLTNRDCILTQWWGYLTYSLLHLDAGHLVLNLALQLIVGVAQEMVHGTKRVMPLYVLGVRVLQQEHWYKMCILRSYLAPLPSSALTVGPWLVLVEVLTNLLKLLFPFEKIGPGLYCLIAASISTSVLNWNEDVAIFFTRWLTFKPIVILSFSLGG